MALSDPPNRNVSTATEGQITATSSRTLKRLGIQLLRDRGVKPVRGRRSR